VDGPLHLDATDELDGVVDPIVEALLDGGVVLLPTDTLYGIAALASDERATAQLFELKGRTAATPIAVLCAHARQAASLLTLQVTGLRLSSGMPGCPPTDLYFNLQSKSSWNDLGAEIANLGPVLWKPFSRGRVALLSPDAGQPLVEFNFLADERDLRRMMIGFRRVVDIVTFPAVRALMGKPFPVRFTDRLRRLNQRSRANALKASLVARVLQVSPVLSDWILAHLTGGADDLASLVADDERLAEHVRANVAGTFHVCGTCRMGSPEDPEAVVDASGRVYGIEGLRVADASVMPAVPRGNTNIPTLMVAEKLSAAIIQGA